MKKIKIMADLCTGCRCCQLRCSVFNTDEFNPFRSFITIKRDYALRTAEIILNDECKGCGICISVCNYGALTWAD